MIEEGQGSPGLALHRVPPNTEAQSQRHCSRHALARSHLMVPCFGAVVAGVAWHLLCYYCKVLNTQMLHLRSMHREFSMGFAGHSQDCQQLTLMHSYATATRRQCTGTRRHFSLTALTEEDVVVCC